MQRGGCTSVPTEGWNNIKEGDVRGLQRVVVGAPRGGQHKETRVCVEEWAKGGEGAGGKKNGRHFGIERRSGTRST